MSRLPGLDLLRAIAIVWIMLFHSFIVGGLGPDFEWLSRFGWSGVDIFFVLSGFLIGTQVLRQLQRSAGVAVCCLAFWLFRDRTGLLANTLGWPLLSFGFGLLVFAGADLRSLIGRWRVPGVGWIAAISYSLYLSHKIVFHVVHAAVAPSMQGSDVALFLTYGLAALLLGAALHFLVERPFLRWRDQRPNASNFDPEPAAA
jgi:peptidoglycan/LPS O-acetylase OafA/YrhL